MTKEAQLYEIGLLLKPELSEADAAAELGVVRSYIEKQGGLLERTRDPKTRTLSYPIKKITRAYFAALQFLASPATIASIRQDLKTNQNILRHLLLSWKREPVRPVALHKVIAPVSSMQSGEKKIEGEPAEKVNEQELDKKLDEILGSEHI